MNSFKNKYFLVRHGFSKANATNTIVSSAENGVKPEYGLTELGQQQAAEAGKYLASIIGANAGDSTVIYTSDFSRALETATIIQKSLNCPLHETPKLRERFFGIYELQPAHENYAIVWGQDAVDENHTMWECESTVSVLNRARSLIDECEAQFHEKNIILVSHGDTMQMVQCMFLGKGPGQHRSVPHLNQAEVRTMN
eukprot:Colp12_sorted_trinity150504_noHs@18289